MKPVCRVKSTQVITDANGNGDLWVPVKCPIVCIKCTSALDVVLNPFSFEAAGSQFNSWVCHAFNASTHDKIAGATLDVVIWYMDEVV